MQYLDLLQIIVHIIINLNKLDNNNLKEIRMRTELTEQEYREEVAQRLRDYINEVGTRHELDMVTFSSGADLDFTLDELENETITFEECLEAIIPVGIEFK